MLFLSLNNKQYAHSCICQSVESTSKAIHSLSLTHERTYTFTVWCVWMLREMQSTFTINTGKEWRINEKIKNNSQHWVRDFFSSSDSQKLAQFKCKICQNSISIHTHTDSCRFGALKSLPLNLKCNLLAVQFSKKYSFFVVDIAQIAIVSNIIFATAV